MSDELNRERKVPLIYPLAGVVIVAALAAVNWTMDPNDLWRWAVAGLFLPVAWAVFELLFRGGKALRDIRGAVVLAAGLLIVSLGFKAGDAAGLLGANGDEMTVRAFGVAMGLVLAVLGNAIPKRIEPLLAKHYAPGELQSVQRFAGWTFVIAGLGYAAVSLFMPIGTGNTVATTICAAAVVLVIGRWLLVSRRAS